MKTPRKHAELIHAWANGAEVEMWYSEELRWRYISHPAWYVDTIYRIKPEPKPDYHCGYIVNKYGGILFCGSEPGANLKLIFDGQTWELKDAEVLS